MQSYMQRQLMQDHRRNTKSVIQSIDEEIGEGLFCKNILMASKDRRLQVDEDCEYTHSLLDNPNISLADKLLIDQRYFQDLTLNQISEIHGCTRNNIIYKLKKVVSTLRYIVGVA